MNDGLARPLRIGRIDYTNVWPVFHHFHPNELRHPAEQVSEMPAVLNRKLREGEIDAAAISSFAYGISSDKYYLLPNLSVSALNRVQSILLFLKSPLEKVIHGKIALTTTSATSVNLLKIIMKKFYGGDPVYEDAEPSLERMLQNADAALLIGDHAIRASWQTHGYRVLDLGEVWNLWTGHWMTFALWAVRREAADKHPEAVRSIYEGLLESKSRGKRDLEPLVSKALRQIGGTPAYWRGYFSNLHHDFGPEQQAGLMLYFRYAKELGLMQNEVDLTEWPAVASGNLSPCR
ncbi:menaquinone biosynthetic enzyme MqnA/MqnD family protein [Cohnella candidum]|uniref:Chorismate dehydratase n=1 Tax=Cohnella candidum TaxID=2674991 RepID=A0A3G3JYY9_9BACL|nr:menaquinone biosynthesis protein [Cohnella candidum]AYQ72719.1 ABC transporter substrate-binding protein [Cohnella candidum]